MTRRAGQLALVLFLAALLALSCATTGPVAPAAGAAPTQALPGPETAPGHDPGGALVLPPARALALTQQDEAFLAARLSRLSYLVYYDEAAGLDARLARLAVGQANRYLQAREALPVIDFDRVVAARKDAGIEAGTSSAAATRTPAFRRLCLSLGADVYLELAFSVKSEVREGKYYALAQGEARLREAATASLLGTIPFEGQPSISPSSLDAAVTNAVTQAVWLAMPSITARARDLLAQTLRRGLCYELVLDGSADRKAFEAFAKDLSARFREVVSVPALSGETDLLLFCFLDRPVVEAAIHEAAASSGFSAAGSTAAGSAAASGRLFRLGLPR